MVMVVVVPAVVVAARRRCRDGVGTDRGGEATKRKRALVGAWMLFCSSVAAHADAAECCPNCRTRRRCIPPCTERWPQTLLNIHPIRLSRMVHRIPS